MGLQVLLSLVLLSFSADLLLTHLLSLQAIVDHWAIVRLIQVDIVHTEPHGLSITLKRRLD